MLVPKPIDEILTDIRDTLQDKQKSRWDDQELYRYLNQGMRDIALQTKYLHLLHTIDVLEGTTAYALPNEAIEFYSISSVQPYEITDPTQLEFSESKVESVVIDYYAYPSPVLYGVTTTLTLESDLFDALVFFALAKAYLKEDTTENFQKSQFFSNEYLRALSRGGRWNGQFDVQPNKTDFYS